MAAPRCPMDPSANIAPRCRRARQKLWRRLTCAEIVYLRGLLEEMGRSPTAPVTKLYIDNAGALELAKDRRSC
eukprot:6203103-Pleurochrysis_carterae.AAC.1